MARLGGELPRPARRRPPGFSALRIPISSNRTSARNTSRASSPRSPARGAATSATCTRSGRSTTCSVRTRCRTSSASTSRGSPASGSSRAGGGRPSLLPRRPAAHDREPLAGERVPLGRQGRRRPRHLDRPLAPLLRQVDVAGARAGGQEPGARLPPVDRQGRARGKMVWAYTYTGTRGTPGFAATEPLSNPRMLMLWTRARGPRWRPLRAGHDELQKRRTRSRRSGPARSVLLYPGPSARWPSARLEQIRDGIEDWAIYNMVRVRRGADDVRAILGEAGLFSAGAAGRTARRAT